MNALHLTEISRTYNKFRADDKNPNTASDSVAAWATLTRLLAMLPFVDKNRTLQNIFVALIRAQNLFSYAYKSSARACGHVSSPVQLCRLQHRNPRQDIPKQSQQSCWTPTSNEARLKAAKKRTAGAVPFIDFTLQGFSPLSKLKIN
jgi:hypothetical protein